MLIAKQEVDELVAAAPRSTRAPRRRSINRMVAKLRGDMRESIRHLLQPSMVMLDEAIRFVLAFEEYQYARKLGGDVSTFAIHLARVRADLLSIRELILLGQESAAMAVARVFVEDVEIAMAIAVDPEFAREYGSTEAPDLFWSKNIGYGKIYRRVEKFFESAGASKEETEADIDYHRRLKTFLSDHIHPTHSCAFRLAFPRALEKPGLMLVRPLGAVGPNLGHLSLFLAEEIHRFAAGCINMFIRPNAPPVLAGFSPNGQLDDVFAAAHVLQGLIMRYADALAMKYHELSSEWETGLPPEIHET